ncbi:MAG TPA: lactate permease [Candidatus Scybalocola faecavium]|nr:lactate permease [Candidatus Scybalocola faecavium]
MKLSKLSNDLLRYMAKSYTDDHNKIFDFSTFKDLYPDLDDSFISDALYLLEHDGFVSVFPADNVAYMTTLLPSAIRDVEEDTFIKKGYAALKEIRSWF